MKKGDLSKFVEEAVREQLFRRALADSRAASRDLSESELSDLVDERGCVKLLQLSDF